MMMISVVKESVVAGSSMRPYAVYEKDVSGTLIMYR